MVWRWLPLFSQYRKQGSVLTAHSVQCLQCRATVTTLTVRHSHVSLRTLQAVGPRQVSVSQISTNDGSSPADQSSDQRNIFTNQKYTLPVPVPFFSIILCSAIIFLSSLVTDCFYKKEKETSINNYLTSSEATSSV